MRNVAAILVLGAVLGAMPLGARAVEDGRGALASAANKPFSLPGLDGVRHGLAEWRGRVVVLNFWASWCGPCLREIPDLVSLQEEYGARGLQVVGVGLDEAVKLANVRRTLDMNYPVLVTNEEAGARLMGQWGNRSGVVPFTVVMDRSGKVVFKHGGPMDRSDFDEQVLPLLAEGVK